MISIVLAQSLSHVWIFATSWVVALWALFPGNFPGKNTGVDCHFLLQGIFPTQALNPLLLHHLYWQVDPLTLNHLGSLWPGIEPRLLVLWPISKIINNSSARRPFIYKPIQSPPPSTSLSGSLHSNQAAILTSCPSTRQLETIFYLIAHWNYSTYAILILLTLPCPSLPSRNHNKDSHPCFLLAPPASWSTLVHPGVIVHGARHHPSSWDLWITTIFSMQ